MSNEKKYVCIACGYVATYEEFWYSEHDPVNDGWIETERCPECGAGDTARANPFQTETVKV